ncbi:Facilitated trehalose transporter Tret1 [Eumeta japonica]|uniref:Facilitated trehalose transporter Tret1 n=1 Tax=Eumeta variegata TaxID=151549 RepID=A0A4C1Z1B2_EUMVA|nr:Facilitated trehalose transporter Tret1 [Eumeta japonica]
MSRRSISVACVRCDLCLNHRTIAQKSGGGFSQGLTIGRCVNFPLLIYGSSVGWMSPMTLILQSDESPRGRPFTDEEISWMASAPFITSVPAVVIFVFIVDKFGIKLALMLCTAQFLGCWAIKLSSHEFGAYVTARLLVGVGMAGCYVVTPLYTNEISDSIIRGALGTLIKRKLVVGPSNTDPLKFIDVALTKANQYAKVPLGLGYKWTDTDFYLLRNTSDMFKLLEGRKEFWADVRDTLVIYDKNEKIVMLGDLNGWYRSTVNGITMGLAGLMDFLQLRFFKPISSPMGDHVTFFFFSAVCLMNAVYVIIVVPETRMRSVYEIYEDMMTEEEKAKHTSKVNDNLVSRL